MYYANLFANYYTWMIAITSIAVVSLPIVLVVLRKTGNVKYAAYFLIGEQLVISVLNQVMRNFHFASQGALWSILLILFAFLVLGSRDGWLITIYIAVSIIVGLYNEQTNYSLFHFDIPPEQIPTESPAFVFLPFLITVYTVHPSVLTNRAAEKQVHKQKSLVETANRLLESKNEDVISRLRFARKSNIADWCRMEWTLRS
ncbi:MAG: hypothetical protein M3R17_21120 [Bacteroidota bacterium]|nr:hypothetical protein [Bacteroidota bacterium]